MGNQKQSEVVTKVKLQGSIELLKNSWIFFKSRYKVLVSISLIEFAVVLFLFLVISFVTPGGTAGQSSILGLFTNIGGNIGIILLLGVIYIFTQSWSRVAMFFAIKDSEENIGVADSYRLGLSKLLSYWWLIVISFLVVTGGFMLFVIPGIILSVSFSVVMFVLIAEDLGGLTALLKSREYVKGYWVGVWFRFFVANVILGLIFVAPGFLIDSLGNNLLETVYGLLVRVLYTPFLLIFTYLVYRNLKSIKSDLIYTPTGKNKGVLVGIGLVGLLGSILIAGSVLLLGSGFLNQFVGPEPVQPDLNITTTLTFPPVGFFLFSG